MGWAVGYDTDWYRWIGYGVPAECDHPECLKAVDRGLAYRCGDLDLTDGGCGLYFCSDHKGIVCDRCANGEEPFEPKGDTDEWVEHMLIHDSWADWRATNEDEVLAMHNRLYPTPSSHKADS